AVKVMPASSNRFSRSLSAMSPEVTTGARSPQRVVVARRCVDGAAEAGDPALASVLGVLPLRDENPVRRTPVLTWLIVAACIAAYLLWQPTPFTDTTQDVEFNLRNAAIPCELVEARP